MTIIRLYDATSRIENVYDHDSVGQWLLDHFGKAPKLNVRVFAGKPSDETEVTGNIEALMRNDAPEYVVLQTPGDAVTAFQVISVVFSVASVLLASGPTKMPANVNRTQQSPNNSLGSRENQVRILQRIEDIFGTVQAVPSLMMPTYDKYIGNRKFEYGFYCASRGYCNLDAISDGDASDGNTLLSAIEGSSAAVYWPFTSPNSGTPVTQIGNPIIDKIVTVARSNEVDGITLKPLNELQLERNATYTFTPTAGGDVITQDWGIFTGTPLKGANFNSIVNPGDDITVTMSSALVGGPVGAIISTAGTITYDGVAAESNGGAGYSDPLIALVTGDNITVSGGTSPGSYTITEIDHSGGGATGVIYVTPSPAATSLADEPMTITASRNYSGTYSVAGVSDGYIILTTETFPSPLTAAATIDEVVDTPITEYTDWIELNAADRTEVWVNIVALNGLVKDNGSQSNCTVEFELSIEKLDPVTFDPTGVVEIVTTSISGSVTDEIDDTVEHVTAWVGPARVRMRRTSQHDFDFAGQVVDEIKWADLYSVTPVAQPHFGNLTTIHTITQATQGSIAVKSRQLNAITSRLIPTYDGTSFSGAFDDTGAWVSGTINPSSKLVDIIAAVSVDPKIGRRDLATDVDMAQIWSVQQQLDAWSAEAGQFNFTFDSDNTSFEETIQQIANAGFCTAYRQNGKIRLALDRPQSSSVAIFTHRNKKPLSETVTRKFAADGDFDGVEFVYTDPDTLVQETIRLPLDQATAEYVGWPEYGSYTTLKQFEIPGIRSFAQAWYRANRELYKLRGQRLSIETSTTMDARALLPNSRVDIVDNTRFQAYDGEVVGQSGLTLYLSQEVEFVAGEPHSMVLMRRDGSVQSIPVTPGINNRQVLIAYAPSEAIVTVPGEDGIRTIYSLASDSARQAMAYLVMEIDLQDPQYPVVRGVNYSDSYYEADTVTVPDKGPIIQLS